MRYHLIAAAVLGLAACNSEAEVAEAQEPAAPRAPTTKADECLSDADGQLACIRTAFELENCDELQVQGSMFKDDAASGGYQYYTAYTAPMACIDELKASAASRGFVDGEGFGLNFEPGERPGYSENVQLTATDDNEYGGIEWERVQK